ncbi:MAG: HdeD family acid-resistance protein [Candidatus Promineifilaceae bacterium]|jgi:uncharacterized membrane protein HdeD (DUF308 family)
MEKSDRYLLLFGGIISLVFGILLFTQTSATLALIMLLVGLTWFIQGIVTLLAIFIDKETWGWKLFGGAIGIAAGLLVLQNPLASTQVVPGVLALILGIFGLLIGISALIAAFQGEGWGAGIFGAVSLVIGLVLIFNPLVGGQALVWLTALLLVIQGALGVILSFTNR